MFAGNFWYFSSSYCKGDDRQSSFSVYGNDVSVYPSDHNEARSTASNKVIMIYSIIFICWWEILFALTGPVKRLPELLSSWRRVTRHAEALYY